MNIFLPYENDIQESVEALDDVRLNKQAVEAYQLLELAIKEKRAGQEVKAGHYHHPVYLFYKNNPNFLAYYGLQCCFEYYYRTIKMHWLEDKFYKYFIDNNENFSVYPAYTPYYMEGSLGQPNYIRTTENVSALFQDKLIKKWQADKTKGRNPKWTNREMPEFYKDYLKGEK